MSNIKVGARAFVKERQIMGTIKFVGQTLFSQGKWVGVELDEPLGKNNGTVGGKIYFMCEEDYGLFVRQNQLEVIPSHAASISANSSLILPKEEKLADTSQSRLTSTDLNSPIKFPTPNTRLSMPVKESAAPVPVPSNPTATETPNSIAPITTAMPSKLDRTRVPVGQTSNKLGTVRATGPGTSPSSSPYMRRKIAPTVGNTTKPKLPQDSALSLVRESSPIIPPEDEVPEPWLSVIRDLTSKVDTLKTKRQEDRIKFKEIEKQKLQIQTLVEQKNHILNLQGKAQLELKNAQKETRAILEQKSILQNKLHEVGDMMELCTVDKELAEEKAENLQTEVNTLKDKVEELSLDLAILQEEIRQIGPEGATVSVSNKQMEQQSLRLKEALVKVRDLLTKEQQGHKEALNDLDREKNSNDQLTRDKENFKTQIEECVDTITILKEQVDLNSGSERMIEMLSDKNLELEDTVNRLQESLDDMEALKEVHEELEENQLALERELREELDIEINKKKQAENRFDQAQTTIADYQSIVEKFRQLVLSLQESLSELRQENMTEKSSREQLDIQQHAMLSLNLSLQASVVKGHSKTIDLELERLAAQQAKTQVNLLLQFLPTSFYTEYGDYDCISLKALTMRMEVKLQILFDQLRQIYKLEGLVDSRSAILNQDMEQIIYISKLSRLLSILLFMVKKFSRLMNTCDQATLRNMGGRVKEIETHEKSLDIFIDLFKQDQLDQSVSLEQLDRAISHYDILTSEKTELPRNCNAQLRDLILNIKNQEESCVISICSIKSLVAPEGDFMSMIKGLESQSVDLLTYCSKTLRKIPSDESEKTKFYVKEEIINKFEEKRLAHSQYFKAIEEALNTLNKEAANLSESGKINNLSALSIFTKAIENIYGPNSNHTILSTQYQKCIDHLKVFTDGFQSGEFDKIPPGEIPIDPLTIRASEVKASLSEAEGMGAVMEEKEKEILGLKKNNAKKIQELSDVDVKVDYLEKKISTLTTESQQEITSKSEKLILIQHELLEKTTEYEKLTKVLKEELDQSEQQIAQLNRTIQARRSISTEIFSPVHHKLRRSPGSATDSESNALINHQNKVLKNALDQATRENNNLQQRISQEQLKLLKPLKVSQTLPILEKTDEDNLSDSEKSLFKQFSSVKREISLLSIRPMVVDITRGPKGIEEYCKSQVNLNIKKNQLAQDCRNLEHKIALLAASQYDGALIETESTAFVDSDFTLDPQTIGCIQIPSSTGRAQNINANINSGILRKLLYVST